MTTQVAQIDSIPNIQYTHDGKNTTLYTWIPNANNPHMILS